MMRSVERRGEQVYTRSMTMKTLLALFVACLCGCAPPAPPAATVASPTPEPEIQAPAPSVTRADALLADLERREAAYKEFERTAPPPPPPPRLEDFVPRAPVPETRAITIAANAAPIPESSAPLSSPAAAQSEEFWKNRMRDAQARLDASELALVAASAQVREVERYVRPDGKMSAVIADNLLRAQESETRSAAAVVFARTQIKNLEEEARRAGIPPGWLRP